MADSTKVIPFPEDKKVVPHYFQLVEEISPGMWIITDAGTNHLRSLASKKGYTLTPDDQVLLAMAMLELVGLREQFDIVKKKVEELLKEKV